VNPLLDLTAHPVIAHRGASAWAPGNTAAAFELAIRLGADALELDVRLSLDGVPVVLHDATLNRTTGGRGPVARHTVAELQKLDAGARFTRDGGRTYPFRGQGIQIPTLADVLLAFPEMPMIVEIKEAAAQAAVRRVLLEQSAKRSTIDCCPSRSATVVSPYPPHGLSPPPSASGAPCTSGPWTHRRQPAGSGNGVSLAS
jgi:glycerophosphoryl diester phosphodiesterase